MGGTAATVTRFRILAGVGDERFEAVGYAWELRARRLRLRESNRRPVRTAVGAAEQQQP